MLARQFLPDFRQFVFPGKHAIKKLQLPAICNDDLLHMALKWDCPVPANAAPCGVIA
jgi:hypothetical protein